MPPRKLLAGIIFITAGIMLFLSPFIGVGKDTRLDNHTIDEDEINRLFGFQLYPDAPLLKKLELELSNLTDGLKVRLVVYTAHTADVKPGDGYVLGPEVTARDGKASITFTELSADGFSALAFKGATSYYIEAVSEDQAVLAGVIVKFVVASFMPLFIGLILIPVGIILVASFYIAKPARKGKVAFYEELPEPVLPGSTTRKPARKKKKTRKRQVSAPKIEKAVPPSIRPQKCPECGANVPSGQMYCPSCYAKV